jgi:hypothetical protein
LIFFTEGEDSRQVFARFDHAMNLAICCELEQR